MVLSAAMAAAWPWTYWREAFAAIEPWSDRRFGIGIYYGSLMILSLDGGIRSYYGPAESEGGIHLILNFGIELLGSPTAVKNA
jgi:hypothetical protein